MKFDLIGAIKILAVEFGAGRSSIEVDDAIGSLIFRVRVTFNGECYSSSFVLEKPMDDSDYILMNEKFRFCIKQIKDLRKVDA